MLLQSGTLQNVMKAQMRTTPSVSVVEICITTSYYGEINHRHANCQ